MSTILYVLLAILLLGILIAIHELGHYATARLTGIPVREFAIGMGPKLWSRTSKKTGIVYSLRAIPMGGFCAFFGEDDPDKNVHNDSRALSNQKLWKRMLMTLMGPMMNFVLAFVVLLMFYWIGGIYAAQPGTDYQPAVSSVVTNGRADASGIRAGDFIAEINGVSTSIAQEDAVSAAFDRDAAVFSSSINGWKAGDAPLVFTVRRGEEILHLEVEPAYDEAAGRNMIGITYTYNALETQHVGLTFGQSAAMSWEQFKYYSTAIFDAVIGLFKGENLDQVAGPIGTVSIISQEVRDNGFEAFIGLLALISVNLGIMNLLPIPGLDGSRIVFMIIEAIRRKPIPPEKEAIVHLVGFVLIFGLMIFISIRDIGNLFR